MQPLKLIIPGYYWDSQIYAGRLYLFARNGEVLTFNWDKLITSWRVNKNAHTALICAFLRSDYLYNPSLNLLLLDSEIKALIRKKFQILSQAHLEVTPKQIKETLIRKQDNPCPFPHTDSRIYRSNLYIGSKEGVFRTSCSKKNKYPVSTRPEKKWDASILSISASYGSLALAAGNEGLFELKLEDFAMNFNFGNKNPIQLASWNCVDCDWAFHSIYGSSHLGNGYLVSFTKEADPHDSGFFDRKFKELISDEKIFQKKGYSWGVQDKLCQAGNGYIEIVKYRPWEEDPEKQLKKLTQIRLEAWKGDIISGGVAVFGVIVECDNAIVVIPSVGSPVTIKGEPINWRVFPRSKHYENQLHLIYDDRLEILSFNHDYLVDQKKKYFGTEFFSSRGFRGASFITR